MTETEQDPALTCTPLPLKRILGYNGNVKNGLHIVESKGKRMVGNIRYASLNSHRGLE